MRTTKKTENFSPVYRDPETILKPLTEITNFYTNISSSKRNRRSQENVTISEETVNTVLDFFNSFTRFNYDFQDKILSKIDEMEFAYPNDNEKLHDLIEEHTTSSFVISVQGREDILNAFNRLTNRADKDPFSVPTFPNDPNIQNHDYFSAWIDQTVEQPWFKI